MSFRKYIYYLSSAWKLMVGFNPRLHILRAFILQGRPLMKVIELPSHGVRFNTRNAMDIWTIKETFLDRFYERYGTVIKNGWTVIDVGAGLGDYSICAAKYHPETMVYAFEPYPASYELLRQNQNLNHVGNIKTFPMAVWSENLDLIIDTKAGEPGSYVCVPLNQNNHDPSAMIVPGISLSEVFNLTGIRVCNLLKMDCEGDEYPILFNASEKILLQIERIILEYHDRDEEFNHFRLAEFLRRKDYNVRTFTNFVHSRLGYLYAWR